MIASPLIRIPNMTKSHILLAFAAATMTLTSCFKEEPLNAECDIEKAYIHVDEPLDMFVKKTDTLATTDQTANVVTFSVRKGTDRTAVAPLFQITPGATISPENGSTQDFSNGGVTYTVTSEDKAWSRTYTVRVNEVADHSPLYDFENFFLEPDKSKYYIWTDLTEDGTRLFNWASGNAGFAIVGGNKAPDKYPTAPLEEGYKGHGVCLTTRSTGKAGNAFKMPIAAGNLFTGEFIVKTATSKPLESTHFGSGDFCVITKKPLKFSGYYQYTPGEKVTNRQKEELEGLVDKGDIYAVLFRNTIKDENGEEVQLTHGNFGVYRESADRRVRQAAFEKYFGEFKKYINTFAAMYAGSVKFDNYFADVRGHESALSAELYGYIQSLFDLRRRKAIYVCAVCRACAVHKTGI